MKRGNSNVLVVIPAYNEALNLPNVLKGLRTTNYNICVIDDGSTDNTVSVLKKENVEFIIHSSNQGQGAALNSGLLYAIKHNYKYIVHFDADGQHDHKDISLLMSTMKQKDVDIVIGSRFLLRESKNSVPAIKVLLLHIAKLFEGVRTGIWLTDAHCGLRLLKIDSCQDLNFKVHGMGHASFLLNEIKRLNLSYAECPVNIRYLKKESMLSNTKRIFTVISSIVLKK